MTTTLLHVTPSTDNASHLDTPTERETSLVLVTGGAGFIGSHTARALVKAGYRVRVFDNLDPQVHGEHPLLLKDDHDFEFQHGDVRDRDDLRSALEGVSHVLHLAALTGVGQSMYDIADYVDVNVTGTANLLELITTDRLAVRRIVLSSSRAVYGEGTHECPNCGIVYPPVRRRSDLEKGRFDVFCHGCGSTTKPVPTAELRPLRPTSIYGWTKKAQEELCSLAAETHGLPVVALRYFNVYGSGQSLTNPYTGIVSIFFSRLREGKALSIYEHGTPERDFVHISDVVEANVKALESELVPGEILNIGSGERVTVPEVAITLSTALGLDARMEDRGEYRVGDIHSCMADLSRARRLLGFTPAVALDEGMREFLAWAVDQESTDRYDQAVDELESFGLFGRSQTRNDEA